MLKWYKNLKKGFSALAPMAGITNSAFRRVCKSFGVDVLYSEMISATALKYNDEKTVELMQFNKSESPYVVQLFGNNPKHFSIATKYIAKHIKPDAIDINFGCPVLKVIKQGAGIALFEDLKRSRSVIEATINASELPVFIKTRAQVKDIDVLRFLDNINDLDVKTIMIHGRTASGGFSGPVDTNIIKKARDYFGGLLIANGGVKDYDSYTKLLEDTQADGIGIGQGALGRPWIFKAIRTGQSVERSQCAVFKAAFVHAKLAEELKGETGIIEMRKHLCWYVQGLPGAKKMREQLVQVESLGDIMSIIKKCEI